MPQMQLPERVLCLVTALDPGDDPARLLSSISAAVRGGVNMIQVQAPDLERTDFFNLAAEVVEIIGEDALVVINDRVDVALAVDAGGVQLGEHGPAVKAARRWREAPAAPAPAPPAASVVLDFASPRIPDLKLHEKHPNLNILLCE